jgi:Spy/CpxP family protein refolding chaperone
MKKLFFLPFILFCFQAFSQNVRGKSPEERAEMMMQSLKSSVSLTEEQVSTIKSIQMESLLKLDALRTKVRASGNPGQAREEMKKLTEANEADIKAVLTPEQSEKYSAWLSKRKEEMRNRRGNRD